MTVTVPAEQDGGRRASIVRAAARLFARKGVDGTTVREIAKDVGVLSGSLYHHFPSKDAIADEILRGYLTDLLAGYREVLAAPNHPRDAFRGLVTASLQASVAHPHATDVYRAELRRLDTRGSGAELTAAATEVKQTWLRVLERGRDVHVFRRDVPVWVVYRMIRDALFHSRNAEEGRAPHEQAEALASLVLDGVSTIRPAVAGQVRPAV
jgi:AcrR family transcriptional regulator